jgi:citrate lyase gamma subunit
MLRDIKLWIIVALGIILVIMLIFWPQSESPKIARLEHENDSLLIRISQHQANAYRLSVIRLADSLRSIESKKVSDSIHAVDRSTIAKLRASPKIVEIIKDNPAIDTLLQAYDSAILHRDNRIRELESELVSSQSLASQAEQNFKATIADYEKLHANMLEQVEHYKKELRKQRRQKRLAIVGGVVFSLGFLLLGSNL